MADEKTLQTEMEIAEETVKNEKGDKNVKKKKSGKASRVVKYFRDLKGEFAKISWPTLSATTRNTAVTLAMCAIVGVLICAVDFGLSALVNLLLKI